FAVYPEGVSDGSRGLRLYSADTPGHARNTIRPRRGRRGVSTKPVEDMIMRGALLCLSISILWSCGAAFGALVHSPNFGEMERASTHIVVAEVTLAITPMANHESQVKVTLKCLRTLKGDDLSGKTVAIASADSLNRPSINWTDISVAMVFLKSEKGSFEF